MDNSATAKAILPPGPKGNLLFTSKVDLRKNILLFFEKNLQEYPRISRMKLGPYHYVNISDPDYIEHVFQHRDVYIKGRDNDNLKFLLGNGLLTSQGDFWMKQRRLMQPLFHKQRLQGFVQKITECANDIIADLKNNKGQKVDMHSEMMKVTLAVVSKTLMSTDASGDFRQVSEALTIVMEGMIERTRSFVRLPYWLPIPRNIAMKQNRKKLDDTIYSIIESRRIDNTQHDDLLTMLMEVQDADTAERMDNLQLKDELITIFLAGHETTANALAFAFYLLAQHPDAKERIVQEVNQVLNTDEISYEQLNKLEYTSMVIKEAMRLYPPAWGILRQAAKDDVIDGHLIKKGDSIVVSPYAVQRCAKYWEEPNKFNPERFAPEKLKAIHRYAYFPFGGGARMCIGNNFAMMEMQIILALICKHCNFTVPENFVPELDALVTLRPRNGLWLNIEK